MLDFGFYNMDCMEGMKQMPDNSVDLTLTDIPYDEVNKAREGGGLRIIKKGDADIITFPLNSFLGEVNRITKNTIIIFCGQGQVSEIYKYFIDEKNVTVRQLVWEKTNPSPMNGKLIYLSGIENAIWVKKRKAVFNGFCKNTVFRYPSGTSDIHPTEKNHDLIAELINDNSMRGGIVFDPCAGSGSTLLVAHNMGRKYIGFELNEKYYRQAKKRLDAEMAQMTIFDMGIEP
jgi:site-specific DNA-methyltransferase (adenine-specific)